MEYIKCNLCGSDDSIPLKIETRIVSLKPPLALVKCKNCGLIYLNPRPPKEEIRNIYKTYNYFSQYGVILETYSLADYVKQRLIQLEKSKLPPRRILEVGCGTGHFLNYAHSRGWDAYGVDISPWAGKHMREKFNLKIFVGELEEAKFKSNFFDVVHMSHVLEHVRNPLATLKELSRVLKKEGILIIEVPNEFSSLRYKIRLLIRHPIFYEIPSPHLFFFSAITLKHILQKAGFRIVKFTTWSTGGPKSKNLAKELFKKTVYFLEKCLNRGNTMEIWAIKMKSNSNCI
jgi:SAM-dependent methyltransferase